MSAAEPRVSLLMPNRDNAPVLDLVLEKLATNSQYDNLELVVVDDGSVDASRQILRRWRDSGRFRDFKLIEQEPSGVIEALNRGLAAATGELIVQLDGDASVETPGWVQLMVDFMRTDERVGVVTAKIVFDWGELHTCGVDMIGPSGFHDRGVQLLEREGRRTYHQRILRRRESDCAVCDDPAEVDGGIGCCMMFRREAALEVGGYDPGWAPVWFDDLDLTMCMRRIGLKVFYLPDVRVIHHVGRRVHDEPVREQAITRARRAVGSLLPARVRKRITLRLNMDLPPKPTWERLQHHYGYWREKWGFDMLNPDMDTVLELWGDTEVCWRYDDERRTAGEQIVAAFEASRRPA